MAAPTNKHGQKNRKTKTFLEFDEKARADYLQGFQKRKTERKRAALEKRDKRIKEERKGIRQQMRDLKKSSSSTKTEMVIPEIERLVEPEVYDLPEHTVTIANIGKVDFVGKTGLRLGQNMGQDSSDAEDSDGKAEEIEIQGKPEKGSVVSNKSLMRKLSNCSNQLSSETAKKNNRRQHVRAKLQAKRTKRKKNKMHKPRKR